MTTIDDMISTSPDPREIKRALSVKMLHSGLTPKIIAEILNVSEQFVSKWKIRYEQEGAAGLALAYQGKAAYLQPEQEQAVVAWIQEHETLSIETLCTHIEEEYGVLYRSKQSYYALLSAGGMSYHRTLATNPKRDEAQILEKREEIKKKWHSTNKQSHKGK